MTQYKQLAIKKQLGNKVIQMHEKRFYGYNIVSYKGLEPDELELANTIANPQDRAMSWDTAYDLLFGKPSAPEFGQNLINN